jgi:hypothetical protein
MLENDRKPQSISVASPTNDRLFDASKTQPHPSEEEVERLIAPNRTGEILLTAQKSASGNLPISLSILWLTLPSRSRIRDIHDACTSTNTVPHDFRENPGPRTSFSVRKRAKDQG